MIVSFHSVLLLRFENLDMAAPPSPSAHLALSSSTQVGSKLWLTMAMVLRRRRPEARAERAPGAQIRPSSKVVLPRTQALPQHSASHSWQKEPKCLLPAFEHGGHVVSFARVDEARAPSRGRSPVDRPPPKPLLVAAPGEHGEYPVLVFLHGYLLVNSSYSSQLFRHVASHGYIVVAPQLYTISGPDTTEEINRAAAVIGWLTGGIPSALPPGVRADLTKVSVSGHSRGGKVAFALALGHAGAKLALPLAALVAVDPVDGVGVAKHTLPAILTGGGGDHPLHVRSPSMVIGTGLGELPRGPLLPPCAPRGLSHEAFYDELGAACHLVARDYGHTDMMDDDVPGAMGCLTRELCSSGGDRTPMRRFVGGATVAFLNKWVKGDGAALDGLRAQLEQAPVALSIVDFDGD